MHVYVVLPVYLPFCCFNAHCRSLSMRMRNTSWMAFGEMKSLCEVWKPVEGTGTKEKKQRLLVTGSIFECACVRFFHLSVEVILKLLCTYYQAFYGKNNASQKSKEWKNEWDWGGDTTLKEDENKTKQTNIQTNKCIFPMDALKRMHTRRTKVCVSSTENVHYLFEQWHPNQATGEQSNSTARLSFFRFHFVANCNSTLQVLTAFCI